MSEELIKRLRTVARDEERAWGAEDEVVILLREAADALSRPAPVQVPAGWKLVPVEPTPEMLAAVSWPGCARTDYAHMLAAAPAAPSAAAVQVPEGVPTLTADERKALERFVECCEDCDAGGHDVSDKDMQRLRAIGAVTQKGRVWWVTEFGDWLLDSAAPSAPATPAVDTQRVIGLVEDYGDAMFAAGISSAHHEHRNERDYRDDADEAKDQIRALLTPAIDNQEAQDGQ